jgi:hypothetical protein
MAMHFNYNEISNAVIKDNEIASKIFIHCRSLVFKSIKEPDVKISKIEFHNFPFDKIYCNVVPLVGPCNKKPITI